MKKILVPVDFSKYSDNALDFAIGLAKAGKFKIVLLHAYQVPLNVWNTIGAAGDSAVSGEFVSEQVNLMEKDSTQRLNKLMEKIKEAGVSGENIVLPGVASDVILETVESLPIAMVVMGTNGAGWLKEILLGSTANKVIEKAKCPVITVPKEATFNGIKKIVYATNYQVSDFETIKMLVEIARKFESELVLLHVADDFYPKEESEEILKLFSEKIGKKIHYEKLSYRLLMGDADEELEKYVKRKRADLFVMSTLHRSFFERFFEGSLTKTIAHDSRMPLMVFHHAEDNVMFY